MIRLRIIVLSVLAGATLAVGATAAVAFPTMKALDPTLSTFSAWPDPHWPIAAGDIANRLFRMLDWFSMACVAVAVLTLFPRTGRPPRSIGSILSVVAIFVLIDVVATNWIWVRPTMHRHLEAYWSAARAGEVEVGRSARAAFDRMHPIASAMLMTQLIAALVGAALTRPAPAHLNP